MTHCETRTRAIPNLYCARECQGIEKKASLARDFDEMGKNLIKIPVNQA
ncbi:MAG: hypothetical protein AB1733_19580 [Thermodesulfobacteriota bacterium]